jgi:leucyl-tRNA synthetase
MKQSEITIAVQINGKVRTELVVVTDITEEGVKKIVMENEVVKRFLDSKIPKRIIYVKNRLINIVV